MALPAPLRRHTVFRLGAGSARGGQLTIELERADAAFGPVNVQQEYVDRTNVLSTTWEADGVRLQVVDSMPWGQPLLMRRVRVTNAGDAPNAFQLKFHIDPVRSRHWSFETENTAAQADGEQPRTHSFVRVTEKEAALIVGWVTGKQGGTRTTDEPQAVGEVNGAQRLHTSELASGASFEAILLLAYGEDADEAESRWHDAAGDLEAAPPGDPDGLERDKQFWTDWLAQARFPQGVAPELEEAYARGLLTLKLLTHEASGAILAAATASFPAVPGGADNWDYRYCWMRDGYYTARMYDEAGLHDEAWAFYEFALASAKRRTGAGASRCTRWTAAVRRSSSSTIWSVRAARSRSASATPPTISCRSTTSPASSTVCGFTRKKPRTASGSPPAGTRSGGPRMR